MSPPAAARVERLPRLATIPWPRRLAIAALLVATVVGGYLSLRDSSLVGGGGDAEPLPTTLAKTPAGTFPLAADGAVLAGVSADGLELPTLEVDPLPSSGRLEGPLLEQALVLGAAPEPMRSLIEKSVHKGDVGVVVFLRDGIELRFGDASAPEAKWAAATSVLADRKLDTLAYIDLRIPERPAVGGTPVALTDDAAEVPVAPVAPVADPAAVEPAEPAPIVPSTEMDPAATAP